MTIDASGGCSSAPPTVSDTNGAPPTAHLRDHPTRESSGCSNVRSGANFVKARLLGGLPPPSHPTFIQFVHFRERALPILSDLSPGSFINRIAGPIDKSTFETACRQSILSNQHLVIGVIREATPMVVSLFEASLSKTSRKTKNLRVATANPKTERGTDLAIRPTFVLLFDSRYSKVIYPLCSRFRRRLQRRLHRIMH